MIKVSFIVFILLSLLALTQFLTGGSFTFMAIAAGVWLVVLLTAVADEHIR